MRPNPPRLLLLSLTLSASLLLSPEAQTVSSDRLRAESDIANTEGRAARLPPNDEPPRIIFSERPAVLVLVDGRAILRPVAGETDLLRVVNTRALIFSDQEKKKYYMRLMDGWREADTLDGPWWGTKDVPPALDRVKDVSARDGQVESLTQAAGDGTFPVIYVSTVPAELIRTKGGPRFKSIKGSNLLYVENTDWSVFYDTESRKFYVLISGHWVGSGALEGPWVYVPREELPSGFKRIPARHPKAGVLAPVPGTPQARAVSNADPVIQTTTAGP